MITGICTGIFLQNIESGIRQNFRLATDLEKFFAAQ
jgi:hypothetical protein